MKLSFDRSNLDPIARIIRFPVPHVDFKTLGDTIEVTSTINNVMFEFKYHPGETFALGEACEFWDGEEGHRIYKSHKSDWSVDVFWCSGLEFG